MNPAREEALRHLLTEALSPVALEIEDQSHLHEGHAAAREGLGHYRVRIVAPCFAGLRPLQRHRLVYEAAGELMRTDIHALSIEALAPGESA